MAQNSKTSLALKRSVEDTPLKIEARPPVVNRFEWRLKEPPEQTDEETNASDGGSVLLMTFKASTPIEENQFYNGVFRVTLSLSLHSRALVEQSWEITQEFEVQAIQLPTIKHFKSAVSHAMAQGHRDGLKLLRQIEKPFFQNANLTYHPLKLPGSIKKSWESITEETVGQLFPQRSNPD